LYIHIRPNSTAKNSPNQGSETRVDTKKNQAGFLVNPPRKPSRKPGKKPTPNLIQLHFSCC